MGCLRQEAGEEYRKEHYGDGSKERGARFGEGIELVTDPLQDVLDCVSAVLDFGAEADAEVW